MRRTIIILLVTALITTTAGGMLCFADSQTIKIPQKKYSVATTQKPFRLNVKYSEALAYSSDRPSVASVSADGRVTVHRKGKATVTVSAKNDPEICEKIHIRVSAHKKASGKIAESIWDYDKKPGESWKTESSIYRYDYRPDTNYYNWSFVIRCNDPQVADKAAAAVAYIVKNRHFGYKARKPDNQKTVTGRNSIYRTIVKVTGKNPAKKRLKKIKKIKKKADTSCTPTLLAGYWLYYDMSTKLKMKWIPPYNRKAYKYSCGGVNVEYHQLEKAIRQVNKEYRKAGKPEPFTIIYVKKSKRRSFFAPKNVRKNLKRGDILCSAPNPKNGGHTVMMM